MKKLNLSFLLLLFIIPLVIVFCQNAAKILNIFVFKKDKFAIAQATLISNANKKYHDKAVYHFKYNGKDVEGSSQGIWFKDTGDSISVYFNKENPSENGVMRTLLFLIVGQLLFVIALSAYFINRVLANHRQRKAMQ